MDINELFRRHQLALIALFQSKSHTARTAAAREADNYAAEIKSLRTAGRRYCAVLSSRTFLSISGNQPGKAAMSNCDD